MSVNPLAPPVLTCSGCMFWNPNDGTCRRYPPVMQGYIGSSVLSWPVIPVPSTDTCGEGKAGNYIGPST